MGIVLKDVSKIYNVDSMPVYAVNHINMYIKSETFMAIIGDSGSGKTTLLKLIGGIEIPTSGEIKIDNMSILNLTEEKRTFYKRENIGFIFQDYNLVDFLNVQDNIILPISLSKKKIDKKMYEYILERLGISKLINKYPNMLSGGEKQRVAIARAVLMQPKVILADEPTGNLDSKNTQQVFELLKTLSIEFKQTVIMVTHNLDLAKKCDYIMDMKDGKVYEK